jgi:hypothetical protein
MAMRRGGPARLGLLGTLLSDERLSGVGRLGQAGWARP